MIGGNENVYNNYIAVLSLAANHYLIEGKKYNVLLTIWEDINVKRIGPSKLCIYLQHKHTQKFWSQYTDVNSIKTNSVCFFGGGRGDILLPMWI